jgi:hypothetical protein
MENFCDGKYDVPGTGKEGNFENLFNFEANL